VTVASRARPNRKRRGTDRAEELMRVALDLFSKQDFASVTIKDIAAVAKLNTALIYYYFKSKEDLFRATIEHATLQVMQNYRRLRERHQDPVSLINDWFDNNLELSEPIRKLVKIMLNYSCSPFNLRSVDSLIERFYREEISILSASIRKGMEQGILPKVDANRLAMFASTHLDGIMIASMIRRNFDIHAAISDLKRNFWSNLQMTKPAGLPGAAARNGRPIRARHH
jgi:AcrR family transcriptional regulator